MLYDSLLSNGIIKRHRLSPSELTARTEEMLALADRDLEYAQGGGLPVDLHYKCAYSAARNIAAVIMLCEGFLPAGSVGQHAAVFQFLALVAGERWTEEAEAYDLARAKRNILEYERPGAVTEAEAASLTQRVVRFCATARQWLRDEHPSLLPPTSTTEPE